MYKVAVLGDRDSIFHFASAGMEVYPSDDAAEALTLLKGLAENCAVIYVTEALYGRLLPELAVYEEAAYPAIIPIPGTSGNTGIGISRVKRSVERAVGSDILFADK